MTRTPGKLISVSEDDVFGRGENALGEGAMMCL